MLAFALSHLRTHPFRFLAPALAIVIGTAFLTAVLVVSDSLAKAVQASVGAQAQVSDVVVTARTGDLRSRAARIARLPGVQAVTALAFGYAEVELPFDADRQIRVETLPQPAELRVPRLTAGTWPQNPGQVVLDATTADRARIRPGDRLTLRVHGQGEWPVTVAGFVALPSTPLTGSVMPVVLGSATDVTAWTGHGAREIHILAQPGVTAEELRERVSSVVSGVGIAVRTGEQEVERLVAELSGDTDLLSAALLGFVAVALFIAATVIVTTFSVLVARRTRELALLRTVGAARGQLLRSTLVESAVVGAIGSVAGTALGLGLAAASIAVISASGAGLRWSLPYTAVLLPPLAGTLTALIAVLVPARAATRVRPLTALRRAATAPARRSGNRAAVAGSLLAVAGFAGLLAGGTEIGVLGGLVSMVGVLMACPAITSIAVGRLGHPLRALGVPGRLAADSATRHPGRMATTVTAVLVGVTLITTMLVGVATMEATLDEALDRRVPVDLELVTTGPEITARLAAQVRRVPGVAETALLPGTTVEIDGRKQPLLGVDETSSPIIRDARMLPGPGEVVVPAVVARNAGTTGAATLLLTVGDRSIRLKARTTVSEVSSLLINRSDLDRLAPHAPPMAIWVRAAPEADAPAVVDGVRHMSSLVRPGPTLNGALLERAGYEGIFQTARSTGLALIAISLVIALISVTNTLSLSVIQRHQELALLRALGLTRRQMRISLLLEGALVALSGGTLGLVLGCLYGVAGAAYLLDFDGETVSHLPAGQLTLVLLGTLLVTMPASVLPSRRATRIPPAASLAEDWT